MLKELGNIACGMLFMHGHIVGLDSARQASVHPIAPKDGGAEPSAAGKDSGRASFAARPARSEPAPVREAARIGGSGSGARLHDWQTAIELLALGAIWGGSFLFMRVAASEFGPLPLVDVRLALGALVLAPFLWKSRTLFTRPMWLRVAAIGVVNSALPFVLFAWGAERAPAGVGAIVNSMAVPFTALAAFAAFGERIGGARAIALFTGFVGVVVLASGRTAGADIGLAVAAGTVASLCYGVSANLVKHYLSGLPPVAVAAATLTFGALLLAPLAAATWPATPISPRSWISAGLLGVLCTGIAYAFYFRLIQRVGAARASTATYLVPLFGVAWGWLLLGEALTPTMAVAGALILGSVVLAQREARRMTSTSNRGFIAQCSR